MTDVELLPLPDGVDVIFSPDGNGAALDVFTAEQVQDYARANVAHATAPLQAEIESLRAEVETLRDGLDYLRQMQGAPDVLELRAKAARADRLAEALRIAEAALADIGDADREPGDDVAWCERRARLGLRIARAALRDHDQEVGNG